MNGGELGAGSVGADGIARVPVPGGLSGPALVYASYAGSYGAFEASAVGSLPTLFLGAFTDQVNASTLSAAPAVDVTKHTSDAGTHTELLTLPRGVTSSASSFTVDTAVDPTKLGFFQSTTQDASITVSAAQTWTAGGLLFALGGRHRRRRRHRRQRQLDARRGHGHERNGAERLSHGVQWRR